MCLHSAYARLFSYNDEDPRADAYMDGHAFVDASPVHFLHHFPIVPQHCFNGTTANDHERCASLDARQVRTMLLPFKIMDLKPGDYFGERAILRDTGEGTAQGMLYYFSVMTSIAYAYIPRPFSRMSDLSNHFL
jgi:hypothetical protein